MAVWPKSGGPGPPYESGSIGLLAVIAGTRSMQSTGQAGTHSSHPVQSGSITTCINFDAPMIASTGQAWMHLVQPMQSASTITATSGGLCAPRLRS